MSIYKNFFKNNPLKDYSAAHIAHFEMSILTSAEMQEKIEETIRTSVDPERQTQLDLESKQISSANTTDDIINIMRKMKERVNVAQLCNKVLSEPDKYIPAITDRFYRIKMDKFVETAGIIFYNADIAYLEDLYENYNNIQFPFAQSMICLLLAMREFKDIDDFLLCEYNRFKSYYPDEIYYEFPLLGLYITNGKF
ncbi:MAG: hypothetical protein IJS61_06280 [Firmicutes bacterium]|nr:hypothetical protein [Bacillota bacterium]